MVQGSSWRRFPLIDEKRSQRVLTIGSETFTVFLFSSRARSFNMAKLRCENVSEGLRASEVVATFRDFRGRRHFIRVERDFLSQEGGQFYLPIGVVHVDPRTNMVLIELPHEAETGINRLWVTQDQLDEPIGAYA
jgi:hypothetical protein